ncbi:MAG: hypothetical protein JXA37_02095 [Chloroflexia bacterium]|nr:hypothetical protein [Chloroflexia bacterium]
MAGEAKYAVTIELNELELATLYHAVLEDQGEHRVVFWEEEGRRRRHYISVCWLESKVFSRIAEMQPEWLTVMDKAQKKLSLYPDR